MSKQTVLAILIATTLVLSACAPRVPKADYDAANAEILRLTEEKATLKAQVTDLTQDVADLQKKADQMQSTQDKLAAAQEELEDWRSLRCDHSWDEVMNVAIMNFLLPGYSGVPEYLYGYISITQWSSDPNWVFDDRQPFSVLLFDLDFKQTLVVDTVEDCIILNPEVFPFTE